MCLKTGVFYGKVDLHDLLIRENKQSRKKEMSLGEAQKAVSIQMEVRGRLIKDHYLHVNHIGKTTGAEYLTDWIKWWYQKRW